jgi:hypothetical protein
LQCVLADDAPGVGKALLGTRLVAELAQGLTQRHPAFGDTGPESKLAVDLQVFLIVAPSLFIVAQSVIQNTQVKARSAK